MRELELKLAVDDPFVTPALPPGGDVAGMEELPALDLRATYYDTHDLRLARNGVTLRFRTGEGDDSGWTLKLPMLGDDGASRDELHFDGSGGRIPRSAQDLVTAFVRSAPLAPAARLQTRRRRWRLRGSDGKDIAELVDDRVSVTKEGRVVERFRELEIESHGIDRPALDRIAATLEDAGASPPEHVPKAVRALGSKAKLPPDVVPPEGLSPRDPAAHAVQGAIAASVLRILSNDPGSRLGDVEPVHQMRVGARRLRSDLRTFAPLVDEEWADRLRDELRWLGQVLGQVRDLDVMSARLHSAAEDLGRDIDPLYGHLEEQHLVARASLLNALRSPRYVKLLDDLVEATRAPVLTDAAREPAGEALPPLAGAAWRRLERAAASLSEDDPDERYHRVRIRAKGARYAAEAVAPALGEHCEPARHFAARAAKVQDVLGEAQDASVAAALLEEVAAARPSDGAFNLAAGRLVEREQRARTDARDRFPRAWRKLNRKKLRKWLPVEPPTDSKET